MDHPSDVSTTTLQSSIEKLFGISNLATTLSYQIREVATVIIGCIQELNPTVTPKGRAEDIEIMGQMTVQELRQVVNLENTRQGLIAQWREAEAQKQQLIDQARTRIADQGGPDHA
ncbi:MAG: hypothetical protein AB1847_21115 [bacterium]